MKERVKARAVGTIVSASQCTSTAVRRKRAWTFGIVCLGVLLIATNSTSVVLALRPIRTDVGFSETTLVWVINAYLIPCGGLLLLGGRLADVYGYRRLFLFGIALYSLASLGCAQATSQIVFLASRAVQGVSGAIATPAAFALTIGMHADDRERAWALGIYGSAWAGGSVLGLLVGGILTSVFGWRSLFLTCAMIGASVCALGFRLLPQFPAKERTHPLDVGGAVALTSALMLAVNVILSGNAIGWFCTRSLLCYAAFCLLFLAFVVIEVRATDPILPRGILRNLNFSVCCTVSTLTYMSWSAVVFCTLYLQLVLGYSSLAAGISTLPYELGVMLMSVGVFAKLMTAFGLKRPLIIGLLTGTLALVILGLAPAGGRYISAILPGLLVMSVAGGMVFNALSLAAVRSVSASDSGLVFGILGTTSVVGYALGLAILASIADSVTGRLLTLGVTAARAFSYGYHFTYLAAAGCLLLAASLAAALLDGESGAAVHPDS